MSFTIVIGAAVLAYVITETRRRANAMKELKKELESEQNATMKSYVQALSDANKQLFMLKEQLNNYIKMPPSFSVNRAIRKLKKQIATCEKNIKAISEDENAFMKLANDYNADSKKFDHGDQRMYDWVKNKKH